MTADQGELRPETAPVASAAARPPGDIGFGLTASPLAQLRGRAPLVGRTDQLEYLRREFEAAAAGQDGRLVLISGEPGVGKTRLAQEVGRFAQARGGRYLEGHYLRDGTPAYGPWAEALRPGLRDVEREEVARWVGGYGPELAPIMPELVDQLGPFPPPAALSPADQRRRLFDGLLGLVSNLSRRTPLVLLLDDLQWAPGLDLLLHLVRQPRELRVLLLGTYRAQELKEQPSLVRGWAELNRARLATELHLHPLTEPETAELVGHYFGLAAAAQLREPVYRRTRGNAFFTEEVLRSLTEVGAVRGGAGGWEVIDPSKIVIPESMKLAVEERAVRLGDSVHEVLIQAAILGQEFSFPALRSMTDRSEDELIAVIDRAAAARLLVDRSRAGEERFAFLDDQMQEVLYQGIPPLRRRRYHLRAGQALEEVYADRLETHLDDLARHFDAGQNAPKSADYALRAAEQNCRLFHWPRALRLYEQAAAALAHLPDSEENRRRRVDANLASVNVALFAGTPEQNHERLIESASLAASLPGPDGLPGGDPSRLGRIQVLLGRVHVTRNEYREATDAYRRALSESDRAGDDEVRVLASSGLGRVLVWQGRFAPARPLLTQADRALEKAGAGLPWIGNLGFLGAALVAGGDYATGLAAGQRAHAAALAANDWPALTVSHVGLTLIHFLGGEPSHLLAESQALLKAADKSGDHLLHYLGQVFRSWAMSRLGDPEAALAGLAQLAAAPGRSGGPLGLADWLSAAIAEVTLATGRAEEAMVRADETIALARSVDGLFTEGLAHRVKALVPLRHREPRSERQTGRAAPARPGPRGRRRRAEEPLTSPSDMVESHLAASLACFEEGGARLEAARTRVTWGQLCADRHDVPAALTHLEHAAVQFQAAGLADELVVIRRLIEQWESREVRGAPRPPALPGGLSARELEVLRHIVAGRTNREIAAELVISVSTVDRHIFNIYAKIGARGRADAVAFALRQGLAET